jgi:hypothetical protein
VPAAVKRSSQADRSAPGSGTIKRRTVPDPPAENGSARAPVVAYEPSRIPGAQVTSPGAGTRVGRSEAGSVSVDAPLGTDRLRTVNARPAATAMPNGARRSVRRDRRPRGDCLSIRTMPPSGGFGSRVQGIWRLPTLTGVNPRRLKVNGFAGVSRGPRNPRPTDASGARISSPPHTLHGLAPGCVVRRNRPMRRRPKPAARRELNRLDLRSSW